MEQDPRLSVEIDRGKCGRCPGSLCCNYVTEELETPRSMIDFDHLLWQVSHRHVAVFKDEDGWFLLFNSPCDHLLPDGACGIYEQRPMTCREYTNEDCELDEPKEKQFELYFDSFESLVGYCRKRFRRWDERFKRHGYE